MLLFTTIAPHNPPVLLMAILCFGIGIVPCLASNRWSNLLGPALLAGIIVVWAVIKGTSYINGMLLVGLTIVYVLPAILGVVAGQILRTMATWRRLKES